MEKLPTEALIVILAVGGGVSRYLNGYLNGVPFRFLAFVSSTFVSGFSGYMFALLGISMNFPGPILFMLAGCGGFFGDQTMKLVMDFVTNKITK